MIFYVYHIKKFKKVGCTTNIKKRVITQQGLEKKDFSILYSTTNKIEASYIERYYQIKLNYKKDKNLYHKLKINKMTNFHITDQTITLKYTNNQDLIGFNLPPFIIIKSKKINLLKEDLIWLKNNNFKSQINSERYVFTEAFLKYIDKKNQLSMEFTKSETIFEKIRVWAKERGIYEKGDPKTQYIKLQEEAGELAKAILNKDEEEIVDAIGDIGVVLTNLSYLCGYTIEECLESSYNVIKMRQGKMENGTFMKNK